MKTYPLFKVHVPVNEAITNIKTVFESGFINEGAQVTQLTQELSELLCSDQLLLLNACTSALTLALRLAGVGPGDEVITTPMTCVATNTPIANSGAKIVWADVGATDGLINAADVARKITPKTKAVMAVAWAGTPPCLASLQLLCEQRGIKLILDAAHAFGAWYGRTNNKAPIHTYADYTCYSFQAIKHFTTGDGGALICKSADDFKRAKSLKWFGLDRDHAKDEKGNWKGQQWDVNIHEAGYKFNMNNVCAAIGLAQIKYANEILNKHRHNANLYDAYLGGRSKNIEKLDRPTDALSSFWVYPMRVINGMRDDLIVKLNAEGIMAGLVHVPNDDYTVFDDVRTNLPGVREFSATQFNLPCGWWLNDDDVKYISARVLDLVR